jgi:hypothetical protein
VLAYHKRELIGMSDALRWVGYLSSTSVYGDHGGDWVDERCATSIGRANTGLKQALCRTCEFTALVVVGQTTLPCYACRLANSCYSTLGLYSTRTPVTPTRHCVTAKLVAFDRF